MQLILAIIGQLHGADSEQFSLNKTDLLKLLRLALVMLAGWFCTSIAPQLAAGTYLWDGFNFTPLVAAGVALTVEALRRFLVGQSKQ